MENSREELLLSLLLEKKLIASEAVAEARLKIPSDPLTYVRLHYLIQKGYLTPSALNEIERDLFVTEELDVESIRPSVISPELPVQEWDRYRIEALLGEGGMARVYRAFDLRLKRSVALKFLRAQDPQLLKRFLKEAQSQAQIQHENVCKIYEVGEVEGKHYIAMQLIKGETLQQAGKKMTLQEKSIVMHQIALAVHAAHRIGIIHRDLKPSNIMVQQSEGGAWYPYVMDFGLARELSVEGATLTGAVLGTPSFMAPEQAWGSKKTLDRRSDVYCLGATLYYLLTGSPPYQGTEMEVLVKLAHEDPVAPRNLVPEIPQDLETIVLKCLEREPDRRYDSAGALAEDLRRYLDGEPILARPSGKFYRLRMKAKKHKLVASLLAGSAFVVMVLGAAGLYTWWLSGKKLEIVREFAQSAETMEWKMRVATMAPLHDVSEEENQVLAEIRKVGERMRRLGKLTEGPGNYALGRGYLALSDFEQARIHLGKAWEYGNRSRETAYAIGLTLGSIYQSELESLQRLNQAQQRERKRKQIESQYRDEALRYLRLSRGLDSSAPEYVEGLISFYEKDYLEALRKARSARKKMRWLHEAAKLEADVWMALGLAEWEKGNYAGAMKNYEEAGVAYGQAIEIGRSDATLYESDCWRWLQILELESARGASIDNPKDQALKMCDLALKSNPRSAVAFSRKSRIWWRWGEEEMFRGRDIQIPLQNTITMAKEAIRWDPRDVYAHFELGNALSLKAEFDQFSGRDPTQWHNEAIKSYRNAIEIDPSLASIHNNIAVEWVNHSRYEMNHGLDPRKALNQAVLSCHKAIQLAKKFLPAWNTMGTAYITKAKYESLSGMDPIPSLDNAIESFRKAQEAHPNHPVPPFNLSTVFLDRGKNQAAVGINPSESLKQSKRYAVTTLEIDPDSFPMAHNNIGQAFLWEAKYSIQNRLNPTELLQRSIENSLKAIESGSNEASFAYNNILETYHTEAEWLLQNGQDPARILMRARKAFDQVLKMQPDSDTFYLVSRIELLEAQRALKQKRTPESSLLKAKSFVSKALELNAKNTAAYLSLAEIHKVDGEWLVRQSLNAQDTLRTGIAYAEQALSLNPRLPEAWALLSSLNHLLAGTEMTPDAKAIFLTKANDALQKAMEINPNLKHDMR